MERDIFVARFRQSSARALDFAQSFVTQQLPQKWFLLYTNQSYDGNPLHNDEEVYPEERSSIQQRPVPFTEDSVINKLWRNGKVPEWVDMAVQECDADFTFINLRCCGRFTSNNELLYHQYEGRPPFHVTGPRLPPGWEGIEKSGKFDLH